MARGSYEQYCGVAAALDAVGERWGLLIVRELLLGPLRFTDLQRDLPRAGPNVLTARLRELEDAGVLIRRRLPAPAAATVYELTQDGRGLEPVLLALTQWGATRVREQGEGYLLPGPVGYYLFTRLRALPGPMPQASYHVHLAEHDDLGNFTVTTGLDGVHVARGHDSPPSASITLSTRALLGLGGDRRGPDVSESADIQLTGTVEARKTLTRLLTTALAP